MNAALRPLLIISLLHATLCGAAPQPQNIEAYRKFALTHQGDVERGKKLFNDQKMLCSNCHTVDGHGGKAGPDLFAAGDAFGRRDIIDSVLMPSATIAPGYGTLYVETKSGAAYQGTLKQSNDEGIQVMGADGKLVSIKSDDIKGQTGSAVSLMPEGLQANLTAQEFTDLIEYLTTLKQPESALAANRAMPADIPLLANPVKVEAFFTNDFKLPRGKVETGLTSFHQVPGSAGTFLVLHQKGMIWLVTKASGGEEKSVFSDMTDTIFSDRGPNGLLGMTFHPKFRENRKYYLFYQILDEGKVTTHIVEKEFAADFKADSGKPARVIIKIGSIAEDHSGGCLQFGPDGFLYIVMGDTGPHNDPNGHAQNLTLLQGKLLRVDVDHQENGLGYAIPKDNPFVKQPEARPEIWSYGLRNPWRFSFDRGTGELWLADIGQERVEEIDIVHGGENFGWNVYEAFEPFSNQYKKEGRVYTQPLFAYRRKYGNSITGGFVYRGDKDSSFNGVYIFGDYNSKKLIGITQENGVFKMAREIGAVPQQRLVSFGQDDAGNLYAVGYEGMIYKIDFSDGKFE